MSSVSIFPHNLRQIIFFLTKAGLSHSLSLTSACQCACLLLLQSPLFCYCCSVSLVSLSTVKQWPGTALPPCGTTDYCKTNLMHMNKVHAFRKTLGGALTILMTEFISRGLYAVPRTRVKSEVHFGLNNSK